MARKPLAPASVVGWATAWLARGYPVLPLLRRSKAPVCQKGESWQDYVMLGEQLPADLARRFGAQENLGIVTGYADSRLADVDYDCPEAIVLGNANILPATGLTWGRASVGITHAIYRAKTHEPQFTVEKYFAYKGPSDKGDLLLELRYAQHQTMAPGSFHPDNNEAIICSSNPPGEPLEIELADLRGYCRMVAGTIILKRVWPHKDSHRRDDFAMYALAGLIRAGVTPEEAASMVRAAASMAGDEEAKKRGNTAQRAAERIEASKQTKGFTSIEKDFNLPGFGAFICGQMKLTYKPWTPNPTPVNVEGGDNQQIDTRTGQPGRNQPGRPSRVRLQIERPYVNFPVHVLPPVVREIVERGAEARNVDPAMIALPALSSLATLIGTTYRITPNGDWMEFPILWTCLLSETGTRKSAGFDIATAWMDAEQCRLHEQYISAHAEDEEALQNWKDCKGDADRGPKPRPTAVARDIYIDDATVESLADVLSNNPRGSGYFAEEGQAYFERIGQYTGSNAGYFLKMYDGKSWSRRRVASQDPERRRMYTRHAALSIALTIQPGIFQKFMTEDNMVSGMLARYLLAWPTPRLNDFQRFPNALEATRDWETLQAALFALQFAEGGVPNLVKLAPEAVDLWEVWHNQHAAKVFNAVAGIVKGADAKLWGQALRLALIFHLCEAVHYGSSPNRMVGVDTVRMALELASWFSEEHARIYWYFLTTDKVAAETLAERVLRWFRRHPAVQKITAKDLCRALKDRSGVVTMEAVKDALEVLSTAGYGESTSVEVDASRSRVEFTVNTARLIATEDDPEPEEE